ncbi:glycerate kinase [Demequina capsici]|uniref:Glycerate kinase n=1 Tax=Demequina capsici TaxID=3075620 RepID=A0AA96F9F2_9MICO|nr:glycerate kinase [Demequina sp. OYTSA14]WNM25669.1 glycerate kinase [Demequina sp. OYTSA14]
MRVVLVMEGWPGLPAGGPGVDVAREAWGVAAPGVDVEALAVGDGGPRSLDAEAGTQGTIAAADAVALDDAVMLAPAAGALRWDPQALREALLTVAGDPSAPRRVVVPVGDAPPAGDAADLWGESLAETRQTLSPLEIVALVASDRPLLGFHGMSAAVREGREADAALAVAAQQQEDRWRERAIAADDIASAHAMLLGPRRLSDQPRTGAAGGLAYALAALGARLEPGAHHLASRAGVAAAIDGADVAVAIVGTLSHAALDHGVSAPVGALAAARGVPAVVVTSDSHVGRRDLMAAGIHAAHIGSPGMEGLRDAVTRAAQTWTPVRGSGAC